MVITENDIKIAEKLFGWRDIQQTKLGWMGYPKNYKDSDPLAYIPSYTASIMFDYEVLKKVRKEWEGYHLQLFLGVLFQKWKERTNDPNNLFLQYLSGDYSACVLKCWELMEQNQ